MIEIKQLVFEYPGTLALNNVTLTVRQGDITALVGPNGAGKTTLLRCIAALDQPLSGSVQVDGVDVIDNPRRVHRVIGYLADFYGLYTELSVRQALQYAAAAHSIPRDKIEAAVQFAAQRLQIPDRLDTKVGALSRGLSQRLAIAQAIVHEPKLLILDEPAAGLDPEARHALSELFIELQQQGMTLLVSSHILAELEEYSTSMVILRNGEIVDHHSLASTDPESVTIKIATVTVSDQLQEVLSTQDGVDIVNFKDDTCTIRIRDDKHTMQQLLATLIQHNVPVYHFGPDKANMQEAYLDSISNEQTKTAT